MAFVKTENPTEKLNAQMAEADSLIDRLMSLYNQWFTGVEKRPPVEIRARLEAMMIQIGTIARLTPAAKFKYQALQSRFQTYSARWDKMVKQRSG